MEFGPASSLFENVAQPPFDSISKSFPASPWAFYSFFRFQRPFSIQKQTPRSFFANIYSASPPSCWITSLDFHAAVSRKYRSGGLASSAIVVGASFDPKTSVWINLFPQTGHLPEFSSHFSNKSRQSIFSTGLTGSWPKSLRHLSSSAFFP